MLSFFFFYSYTIIKCLEVLIEIYVGRYALEVLFFYILYVIRKLRIMRLRFVYICIRHEETASFHPQIMVRLAFLILLARIPQSCESFFLDVIDSRKQSVVYGY